MKSLEKLKNNKSQAQNNQDNELYYMSSLNFLEFMNLLNKKKIVPIILGTNDFLYLNFMKVSDILSQTESGDVIINFR